MMEVNRLLGDEIVYELQIRGLPVQRLVNENRATLRGALRMERQGYSSSCCMEGLIADEEYEACHQKLKDLGDDFANFDLNNRDNEHKRIKSRLMHISSRLRRVPAGTEEQEVRRSELLGLCLRLVDEVEEFIEGNQSPNHQLPANQYNQTYRSILDEPIPLIPEDIAQTSAAVNGLQQSETPIVRNDARKYSSVKRDSRPPTGLIALDPEVSVVAGSQCVRSNFASRRATFDSEELGRVAEFQSCNTQPTSRAAGRYTRNFIPDYRSSSQSHPEYPNNFGQPSYCDVSRWKLQFDGESSVTSFLERVEELRVSRNISNDQLLRSAVELFTKDALLWYRTQKFSSWGELVNRLKQDFQPYDYELDLWEEIRKRTQGARERVISYVAVMENLFNRLGENKPTEKCRVDWIRRGLLPPLQAQLSLQRIDSVSELTRLGRMVEETLTRTEKFCPPPTNYRNLLEPDLAYRKSSNRNLSPTCSAVGFGSKVGDESNLELSIGNKLSNGNLPICWNCGKSGHRFKKCSESRKVFCFRCGRENVVVKTCPICSGNQRGVSK